MRGRSEERRRKEAEEILEQARARISAGAEAENISAGAYRAGSVEPVRERADDSEARPAAGTRAYVDPGPEYADLLASSSQAARGVRRGSVRERGLFLARALLCVVSIVGLAATFYALVRPISGVAWVLALNGVVLCGVSWALLRFVVPPHR